MQNTHNHDHDHDHDHHAPKVSSSNIKRIFWVFCITALYAFIQAGGGIISGSLALIADAGHMFSDAAALLLALIAYKIAARSPDDTHSYGYHRVRVLAALANGVTLLLLVVWIVIEALQRFWEPVEVMASSMLVIAIIGLIINIVGAVILSRGNQSDANLQGAFLHVLSDLLGSVGAIAAAIGIMLTGWMILDPILSIFVSVLVVRSAWRLVAKSIFILLQGAPKGLHLAAIETSLKQLPSVASVGHFHAWTLTDESVIATLHVTPAEGVDSLTLPEQVAHHLRHEFNIDHLTVQVDPPNRPLTPHQ